MKKGDLRLEAPGLDKLSAAEVYDHLKGKDVKVKNSRGQIETGWEVVGADKLPEADILVKKKAKLGYATESKYVSLKEFLSWQEQ